MKINLIAVGSLKKGPEWDLMEKYQRRLYWQVTTQEIIIKKNLSKEALKKAEAEKIKEAIFPSYPIGILDEQAPCLTSRQMAEYFRTLQEQRIFCLNLVIGGPEGLAESIRQQAQWSMALGRVTWPHLLVRALLFEQIYRVQQILHNHPYHRD